MSKRRVFESQWGSYAGHEISVLNDGSNETPFVGLVDGQKYSDYYPSEMEARIRTEESLSRTTK